MAIFEVLVPPPPGAPFRQVTALGDTEYELNFEWNGRGLFWTLDVRLAEDSSDVVTGVVLVTGIPLLSRVVGRDRPDGELVVVGGSPRTALNELGAEARVFFVDGEDLPLDYAPLTGGQSSSVIGGA